MKLVVGDWQVKHLLVGSEEKIVSADPPDVASYL